MFLTIKVLQARHANVHVPGIIWFCGQLCYTIVRGRKGLVAGFKSPYKNESRGLVRDYIERARATHDLHPCQKRPLRS